MYSAPTGERFECGIKGEIVKCALPLLSLHYQRNLSLRQDDGTDSTHWRVCEDCLTDQNGTLNVLCACRLFYLWGCIIDGERREGVRKNVSTSYGDGHQVFWQRSKGTLPCWTA